MDPMHCLSEAGCYHQFIRLPTENALLSARDGSSVRMPLASYPEDGKAGKVPFARTGRSDKAETR